MLYAVVNVAATAAAAVARIMHSLSKSEKWPEFCLSTVLYAVVNVGAAAAAVTRMMRSVIKSGKIGQSFVFQQCYMQ